MKQFPVHSGRRRACGLTSNTTEKKAINCGFWLLKGHTKLDLKAKEAKKRLLKLPNFKQNRENSKKKFQKKIPKKIYFE
jgi:hypothetical protein